LSQAWEDIRGLFGLLPVPLISQEALYYLRSYALLLLAAVVGATPLVRNCAVKLDKKEWSAWLWPAAGVALLLVCTAYLVDGSFNPFLYFRF